MKSCLCLLALVFVTGLGAEPKSKIAVGQPAPGFSGVTDDGASFSLDSCKGRVVLLTFFVIAPGPCQDTLTRIEKEVWTTYKAKGLEIITVGRDHSVKELAAFKQEKKFSFRMVADPKREIFDRYADSAVPRCYLIDRDGRVILQSYGYDYWPFEHLKEAIAAALSPAAHSASF
jgi:peroxiredoxin